MFNIDLIGLELRSVSVLYEPDMNMFWIWGNAKWVECLLFGGHPNSASLLRKTRGKVFYLRIPRIHIQSGNWHLHSCQPWDQVLHSSQLRESMVHIQSRNSSQIHVSHGNSINSLHWLRFNTNSRFGCESVSNSHGVWE